MNEEPDRPGAERRQLTGSELLDFLQHKMSMSGRYQPLFIRELIAAGGALHKDKLALLILQTDQDLMSWARRTVMRWPKRTLERHEILEYDRVSKTFHLNVQFQTPQRRDEATAACDDALRRWKSRHPRLPAPRRYQILDRDGARCLACGVPASSAALDVDHIVPRSLAKKGQVDKGGRLVPVDDPENLQTLCASCNREKRDNATTDFRPSAARLQESLRLISGALREEHSDLADDLDTIAERL